MRLTRIYTPQTLAGGATVTLDTRAALHCARVLRMRMGDAVILFNGEGGEYHARLQRVCKTEVSAKIDQRIDVSRESALHTTLYQALVRGERMDYALQKAVELGVNELVPVITRRCVVQLDADKTERRMHHWQGVIINACEQSGRTRLPLLHPPLSLDVLLAKPGSGRRLLFSPEADHSVTHCEPHTGPVSVLIGPEGGLEEKEISACEAAGFTAVRFGPRILRTETAGGAAIAALQCLWGDLCDEI